MLQNRDPLFFDRFSTGGCNKSLLHPEPGKKVFLSRATQSPVTKTYFSGLRRAPGIFCPPVADTPILEMCELNFW